MFNHSHIDSSQIYQLKPCHGREEERIKTEETIQLRVDEYGWNAWYWRINYLKSSNDKRK